MFITDPNSPVGFSTVTGLPALVGSEKQVAWAERIRADRVRYLCNDFDNRWRAAVASGKFTTDQKPGALAKWWDLHQKELTETSAKVWIDRR